MLDEATDPDHLAEVGRRGDADPAHGRRGRETRAVARPRADGDLPSVSRVREPFITYALLRPTRTRKDAEAMDMDERWLTRRPQRMLETFHDFQGEGRRTDTARPDLGIAREPTMSLNTTVQGELDGA